MTADEAKREVNKAFEPAFANYIIEALTNGATCSDKRESSTDAVSRETVLKSLCELGYGDEENGAEAEYMYALQCVADKVKALPSVTPERTRG